MPSLKIIGLLVLEKILKVFTIYGHGGYLGHVTKTIVTKTIFINLCPLFPTRHSIKFGFVSQSVFRGDV